MSIEVTTNDGIPRASAPQFAELTPGTIVGEYQIDQKLGRGGMGCVYAAVHPVIGKHAAIKVLHPELSVNQEAVDRFVQEARAVNRIQHANIIDIFSFGQLPDGRCYFIMELLRGETLRDRVLRGAIPMPELLDILETITHALDAAHAHRIAHRDLKPDNIYLADTGTGRPVVKLLDFGIAKLLGQDSLNQTNTGNLLGTPPYLSPEQARGGSGVDHRTDIYALGAVMFELLTNEFVFPADSGAEMIAKHLYEPPRAASTIAQVPPALDAVMTSMLAKSAADRPTLAQVRGAISVARQQFRSGIVALPPTPRTKPRIWLIALIAIATIGIGLGIVIALRADEQPAPVAAPDHVQLQPIAPPAPAVVAPKTAPESTIEPAPEPPADAEPRAASHRPKPKQKSKPKPDATSTQTKTPPPKSDDDPDAPMR